MSQYTANALISHNRILGRPAGLDNASVSAGQEDHASIGVTAALKALEIIDNTFKVIAIEMMCAAQAIDLFAAELKKRRNVEGLLGEGTGIAYEEIRKITRKVERDRQLSGDLDKVTLALRQARIVSAIEQNRFNY